ncbi:MAG: heme d1 biosynthesis radical SAM protein NirJ, partial [Proteobacteria bacterium]|nr:heme d1 biosynthesis radical SAM protein NirJ [Pseudomonadota bacterium]
MFRVTREAMDFLFETALGHAQAGRRTEFVSGTSFDGNLYYE